MLLTVLKSKIHRARITGCSLDYMGSLTVDRALMDAAGLIPYEKIGVANLATGGRFETYVIPGPAGSGVVELNGAAARLGAAGDRVIVFAYAQIEPGETVAPRIVLVDDANRAVESRAAGPPSD